MSELQFFLWIRFFHFKRRSTSRLRLVHNASCLGCESLAALNLRHHWKLFSVIFFFFSFVHAFNIDVLNVRKVVRKAGDSSWRQIRWLTLVMQYLLWSIAISRFREWVECSTMSYPQNAWGFLGLATKSLWKQKFSKCPKKTETNPTPTHLKLDLHHFSDSTPVISIMNNINFVLHHDN